MKKSTTHKTARLLRKKFLFLLFCLLFPLIVFGQVNKKISNMEIDSIYFIVNKKDTLNHKQIKKKALTRVQSIEIQFYLNKTALDEISKEALFFEVKLYRKSATRWLSIPNKNLKLERKAGQEENIIIFKKNNIPKGLWKIILFSFSDKGIVLYDKKREILFLIQ